MSQKNAIIILLDIGKSVNLRPSSVIEEAKKATSTFIQRKISSVDEVGVFYFGSKATKNEQNETFHDEYLNIFEAAEVGHADINHFKCIDSLNTQETGCGAQTDLFGAIIVAADVLEKRFAKRVHKKRIFIVTDAGGYELSEEDRGMIVQIAEKKKIQFDVFGIEFDDIDDESNMKQEDSKKKITPKQKNEQFLQELCGLSGGVVISPAQAIEMLNQPRPRPLAIMRPAKFDLEIGDSIQIPVSSFTRGGLYTRGLTPVTAEALKEDLPLLKVKVKRLTRLTSSDNPDLEVTDLVKGYRYGKNFVPVHDNDKHILAYPNQKCLKVLGFSDESAIPRHSLQSTSGYVIARQGDKHANEALTALIRALAQLNQVAIVRYCYRAGTTTKLCALYPITKPDRDFFIRHDLPFSFACRHYTFKSLAADQPSDQLQAAEDLIRSMDLMGAEDDMGNKFEAFKPTQTLNPVAEAIRTYTHYRALHPNDPLPPLDESFFRACYPEKASDSFYTKLVQKCEPAFQSFQQQFPLKRIEKTSTLGKRKYWFATNNEISLDSYNTTSANVNPLEANVAIAQQAKRLKPTDEDDDNFEGNPVALRNLFNDKADDVGTTDPAKDFNEMVSRRDIDLVDKAISQMTIVIMKLIKESINDQYYQKCQDCILALRTGCIKEEEAEKFNNFLRELKRQYSSPTNRRFEFWEKYIVNKNITLISEEEADDIDDVTPQMAKDFLHKQLEAAPVESVEAPKLTGDEEEDLFGDLE